MEQLKVEGISKSFDGERMLEDVPIAPNKGELVSLLGINGDGKTTLSSIIAELPEPDTGHALLDGEDATGCPGRVSYVLQKDLLLPYRTIGGSVVLPLIIKGTKEREARELTSPYFRQFGLEGTQRKYPSQLSGGARQGATLLRTYLFSGNAALLDGPFSVLDMMTKRSVHDWYLKVMDETHLSTLSITRDTDEAVLLSDRIYLPTDKSGRTIQEPITGETKSRNRDLGPTAGSLEHKRHILKYLERIV